MKKIKFFTIIFFLIFSSLLFGENPVGKVVKLSGRVDFFRAGRNFAIKAKLGQNVYVGDIFRVKSNSFAEIKFINNNILKIGPKSKVKIENFYLDKHASKTEVKLSRGKVEALTPKKLIRKIGTFIEKNIFEVKTPTAVAGVKGTNFIVFHINNITGVLFLEGKGYVYNPKFPNRIRHIKAGEISYLVNPDQPPTPPRKATESEIKTVIAQASAKGAEAGKTEKGGSSVISHIEVIAEADTTIHTPREESPKKTTPAQEPKEEEENKKITNPILKDKVETQNQEEPQLIEKPPRIVKITLPNRYVNQNSLKDIKIEKENVISIYYSTDEKNWVDSIDKLHFSEGENTLFVKGEGEQGKVDIKDVTFIYDSIPPKFNIFNTLKDSFVPDGKLKISVNDANFNFIKVNEIKKNENIVSLDELNLTKGLNFFNIEAYDKANNFSVLQNFPVFITDKIYNLKGRYSFNNFIGGIENGILALDTDALKKFLMSKPEIFGKGVSLFYFSLENPVKDTNINYSAGGTIGDSLGYWWFNNDDGNKFYFIMDNYAGFTDNIENEFINTTFINEDTEKDILSTNYLYVLPCHSVNYSMENLKKNSGINLKVAFLPDKSIIGIGAVDSEKENITDFFKGIEDFSLRKDRLLFKTLGNLGFYIFNNKVYGNFIGYIEDNNGLKELISFLPGRFNNNIKILSFKSNNPDYVKQINGDIKEIENIRKNYRLFTKQKEYQLEMSILYSNLKGSNRGLSFGEITGKILNNQLDLTKLEHGFLGYENDANFTKIFFWDELNNLDNTENSFLKEVKNGIMISPTKIVRYNGFFMGDFNTKEFSSAVYGTWNDLKYFAYLYYEPYNDSYIKDSSNQFFVIGGLGSEYSLLKNDGSAFNIIMEFSSEIKNRFSYLIDNFNPYSLDMYRSVTYEDDSFLANMNGYIDDNLNMEGFISGIYSNIDGGVGLLLADVSGKAYNDVKKGKMEGTFYSIFMEDKVLNSPESLYEYTDFIYGDESSNYMRIKDEKWGIFTTNFNYQVSSATQEKFYTYINHGELNINNQKNTFKQTTYGFGATLFVDYVKKGETPITWISVGKALGVKDITDNNFKVIINGAWFETKRFLELAQVASTNPDLLKKLQYFNIPCVEAGKVDLEGSDGNLDVIMKDVTFYSVKSGEKPKVWASGKVVGTYFEQPILNETVNLSGGKDFTANFIVKNWENHKWIALISDGSGSLNDKYKGQVNFKGVAAGTYIENVPTVNFDKNTETPPGSMKKGEFRGTASGIVQ